jgi:hypothetical protein
MIANLRKMICKGFQVWSKLKHRSMDAPAEILEENLRWGKCLRIL